MMMGAVNGKRTSNIKCSPWGPFLCRMLRWYVLKIKRVFLSVLLVATRSLRSRRIYPESNPRP